MCTAVANAIEAQRHLVVQAGTGTGKSLAYLLPAVLSGEKVVVATATKALQDQLADKDLPFIAHNVKAPFSYAVLKGRNNYLCRQRATELDLNGVQETFDANSSILLDSNDELGDGLSSADLPTKSVSNNNRNDTKNNNIKPERFADQVRSIITWGKQTQTGDRADLGFEPDPKVWSMVSVGSRECPGAFNCPSGSTCFTEAARTRAASADLVITNLHLYGAHIASGGAVLPDHKVVILDESHELEDVMTESLGVELTPGRLRTLAINSRSLVNSSADISLLDSIVQLANQLNDELVSRIGTRVLLEYGTTQSPFNKDNEPLAKNLGTQDSAYLGRERSVPFDPKHLDQSGLEKNGVNQASTEYKEYKDPDGPTEPTDPRQLADMRLAHLLELASQRIDSVVTKLRLTLDSPTLALTYPKGADNAKTKSVDQLVPQRNRVLNSAMNLRSDLARFALKSDDEVAWISANTAYPVLRLSPIDVGPSLSKGIWSQITAILTTATMPQRILQRVGLDGFDVTEMSVGSPFDYSNHALLYVAKHLPDRQSSSFESAFHEELLELIGYAGGRTLALFTSKRALTLAANNLRESVPYHVLVQGDQPKRQLVETFLHEETSCLFATMGYWQGIDIQGSSLSLVAIDRLPFPRPDDPLIQARRDRAGTKAFSQVDLPRAATMLAQGIGRLIRSMSDYGVAAVLDPRLATASYRHTILAGLPPMRRTTDRQHVKTFLERLVHETPNMEKNTKTAVNL